MSEYSEVDLLDVRLYGAIRRGLTDSNLCRFKVRDILYSSKQGNNIMTTFEVLLSALIYAYDLFHVI